MPTRPPAVVRRAIRHVPPTQGWALCLSVWLVLLCGIPARAGRTVKAPSPATALRAAARALQKVGFRPGFFGTFEGTMRAQGKWPVTFVEVYWEKKLLGNNQVGEVEKRATDQGDMILDVTASPAGEGRVRLKTDLLKPRARHTGGQIDSIRDGPPKEWESRFFDAVEQELNSGSFAMAAFRTLGGHGGTIWRLCISGESVATACDDGLVRLLKPGAGSEAPGALSGHQGAVFAVAFSPDARWLASSGADGTVRLWESSAGALARTLQAGAAVHALAFAADSRTLAAACVTKNGESTVSEVKVWDAVRGDLLTAFKVHDANVWSIALAPDGKTLLTAATDGTASLWDLRGGKAKASPSAGGEALWAAAAAPDGSLFAVGGAGGTVQVWDRGGKPVASIGGLSGTVNTVAFTHDSRLLAAATSDGSIRIAEARTGRVVQEAKHAAGITTLAFLKDASRLATAGMDRAVTLWDLEGAQASNLPAPQPGPDQQICGRYQFRVAFQGNRLMVTEVMPGGKAERAGLHTGDEITRVGGERPKRKLDLLVFDMFSGHLRDGALVLTVRAPSDRERTVRITDR